MVTTTLNTFIGWPIVGKGKKIQFLGCCPKTKKIGGDVEILEHATT
jgi:hypothetical protein